MKWKKHNDICGTGKESITNTLPAGKSALTGEDENDKGDDGSPGFDLTSVKVD